VLHLRGDLHGQEGGEDVVSPEDLQALQADHHECHEGDRPKYGLSGQLRDRGIIHQVVGCNYPRTYAPVEKEEDPSTEPHWRHCIIDDPQHPLLAMLIILRR
jgi:hypothetical protein